MVPVNVRRYACGRDNLVPQGIGNGVSHAVGVCVAMSTPMPGYDPGFVLGHRVDQDLHQPACRCVSTVEGINGKRCACVNNPQI